jgi:hypothetical protein
MKMTRRKLITWGYIIAAGWFLSIAHARGEIIHYGDAAKAQETKYKTPEDVFDAIPIIGELPRTFLFGDGYKVKLSGQELRIDHMGLASNSQGSQRTCMIGVTYLTPVAGFFTTRVDLPLFHSPTLAWSDWSSNRLGDYVMYMSRLPESHPSLSLTFTARF